MKLEKSRPREVDEIMKGVSDRFGISNAREGMHCTDGIYCLRKTFWNKLDPLPPSPDELLYFLLGLGLQEALLGGDNQSAAECDGILVSPDYWKNGVLGELKTTRMGEKSINEKGLPDGWVKQMMAYAYVLGVKQAFLIVLPLIKVDILSYVLTFEQGELEENWDRIVKRIRELEYSLATKTVPSGEWGGWQCKSCRFNYRCQVGGK